MTERNPALDVPYREREQSVDLGTLPAPDMPVAGTELEPETELLTINIGPHHPATHGVLRLLCTLQGETVLDIEPIVGQWYGWSSAYMTSGMRSSVRP